MSGSCDIEQRLTSVLHDSAKKLNLSNYTINLNLNAIKGDGLLGEFYKVSITNNDTKEEIKLAVKKAPEGEIQREVSNMTLCYKNEIRFYSVVYPVLQKFEKKHKVSERFDCVPEYITSVSDLGKEMIVLRDITNVGFQMRERDLLLDDEHASLVFKTYGHFHAISFCLKDQSPEEFEKLTQPFRNVFALMPEKEPFQRVFSELAKECYDILDGDNDGPIKEKFKKYLDKPATILSEALKYSGNYAGFLHGDCWSNNLMFKYQSPEDKTNLENLNLIDFQTCSVGTPVYDLSYFFYTGGSKKLFDKLEDYLDVYYESFSKAARNLGGNPEELLPREALTQDWKQYSKFGMLLGLKLTQMKLISKQDVIDRINKFNDENVNIHHIKYNRDIFKIRAQDIIRHMYEIDAL